MPQPLEFHRGRRKCDVHNSPKNSLTISIPQPSLKLSFMLFSLSLSSDELVWRIKGRVFKGFSTSNVLFWPENPWQKLHSIFPAHNLCCFVLFRSRSQLIGCQQNNLVEERTPGEVVFFQWGNANLTRLCETSESITVPMTERVEKVRQCVFVNDKDSLLSHYLDMRNKTDNSSFSLFIMMS